MPNPNPKIAVAILNWNGQHYLERFMPSVSKYSTEANIYVIDNASDDESINWLEKNYPTVKIIANDGNYGYAGGYNKGMEKITEEYVVLLNSDVEVTEDWLQPIIKTFADNPQLAALQPKIKDLNRKRHFEYAGASGGYIDYLGYPFCRGRLLYELEEDQAQYDSYQRVFWATGACLVIKNSLFLKAGKLNEKLFAHMEEIDLCWRLHHLGYEIGCCPQSVVYHLGGGTLNKLSSKKTFLNFRNNLIIMFLNMPDGEAFLKILTRLILDGGAALKFLIDGLPSHFWAVLRAHFAFYQMFPGLVKDKTRSGLKPLKSFSGVYNRSMVLDFYFKKLRKFSQLPQKFFTRL